MVSEEIMASEEISKLSDDKDVISYYLKSTEKDRYADTCRRFNITQTNLIDIIANNQVYYAELFRIMGDSTIVAVKFNQKMIEKGSDLLDKDDLSITETQIITIASKTALEMQKQVGKNLALDTNKSNPVSVSNNIPGM